LVEKDVPVHHYYLFVFSWHLGKSIVFQYPDQPVGRRDLVTPPTRFILLEGALLYFFSYRIPPNLGYPCRLNSSGIGLGLRYLKRKQSGRPGHQSHSFLPRRLVA